jgi:hypothetical protein
MEQKNINVSINEGDAFFCHELSLNYNPLQFVFDFKSITPRVDIRTKQSGGPIINIKHNVVMVDPYHAKKMLELLERVVKDYEKDFGKITKPKAVEKMEKNMNTKTDKKEIPTSVSPTYFG